MTKWLKWTWNLELILLAKIKQSKIRSNSNSRQADAILVQPNLTAKQVQFQWLLLLPLELSSMEKNPLKFALNSSQSQLPSCSLGNTKIHKNTMTTQFWQIKNLYCKRELAARRVQNIQIIMQSPDIRFKEVQRYFLLPSLYLMLNLVMSSKSLQKAFTYFICLLGGESCNELLVASERHGQIKLYRNVR